MYSIIEMYRKSDIKYSNHWKFQFLSYCWSVFQNTSNNRIQWLTLPLKCKYANATWQFSGSINSPYSYWWDEKRIVVKVRRNLERGGTRRIRCACAFIKFGLSRMQTQQRSMHEASPTECLIVAHLVVNSRFAELTRNVSDPRWFLYDIASGVRSLAAREVTRHRSS